MDVVILTNPGDFHSVVVAAALRQKGASVSLWHTTDFPSCQLGAIWLENGAFTWEVGGPDLDLHSLSPRAFWLRRPEAAVLPTDLDPADRKVALQECRHFFAGLLRGVGMGSYCVNPIGSYGRASLKVEQLKAALSCGFQIPPTLFSNQPKRIRSFVRQHEAIYKAFAPVSWSLEDGVAVLFSTPVTEADLPEDAILMAVPGIFQAKVPKAYELRITAIGQHLFAARLDSQSIPAAALDWRAAATEIPVHPYDLPEPVVTACRRVMANLNLVFGCFDLIVTPAGEYVFLEINEAGAFLWVEEKQPQFLLLDAFCELLLQRSSDFTINHPKSATRFADVYDEALLMKAEASQIHVACPVDTIVDSPR